jgi:hypothetical protein
MIDSRGYLLQEATVMFEGILTNCMTGYERLAQSFIRWSWDQWQCAGTAWKMGLEAWKVMIPITPSPGHEAESLEQKALERMKSGYAPPREIYDIRNRQRIDWTQVPEWAQPSDPELFEGSGHEG